MSKVKVTGPDFCDTLSLRDRTMLQIRRQNTPHHTAPGNAHHSM